MWAQLVSLAAQRCCCVNDTHHMRAWRVIFGVLTDWCVHCIADYTAGELSFGSSNVQPQGRAGAHKA